MIPDRRIISLLLGLLLAAPAFPQATEQAAGLSPVQLVHESRESLGAGNLDRALEMAEAAVDADPAYAAAWKQQGRVQMLRGDYNDALASFRTALELAAGDPDVRVWVAQVLLELGKAEALVGVLTALNATSLDRLGPGWFADAITRLLERGDAANASRIAERLAAVYEHPAVARTAEAIEALAAAELESAQRSLLTVDPRAADWAPLPAAAWSGIARAYLEIDRPAAAITAQQRALRLRPNWIPALRDLGWAYRRAGQPERAADTWEDSIEQADQDSSWWLWVAEARFDARQASAAARAAGRVLEYEPDHQRAQALRLAALILDGDEASAAAMREALAADPAGQRAVAMGDAMAAVATGDHAGAANMLEALAEQSPDDADVKRMRAEVYAGWAASETGAATIAPLEKLVKLDPGRAGAWRDLGWGYWVAGREDEALDAWDRAVRQGVARRERLAAQVVARLVEQGGADEAIAVYRRWFPDAGLLRVGRRLVDAGLLPAAEPILLAAWESGEDRSAVGLELGYVEARNGICVAVPERFSTVMPRLGRLAAEETDKVFKALAACAGDPGIQPLIDRVLAALGDKPEYQARLAGVLLRAAESRARSPDRTRAYELYKKVLETDPDQPGVWLSAATVGESLGRDDEVALLLARVAGRTGSAAVRHGIQGYQAARADRLPAAVAHYRQSLEADPEQPALRMALFEALMSLERYEPAQAEADWFVRRWLDGDTSMRSYLAEIRNAFGQGLEALQHWEALYLSAPQTSYYGVEAARVMFDLCRVDQAQLMLEQMVTVTPDPRAYELLSEIALARGRFDEALRWTETGLEHGDNVALLRARAEAAEAAGRPGIARAAAEALLARDPGNVFIARLLGRALLAQGERDAAEMHFAALLERNDHFVPALVRLKDFASEREDTDAAADLATRLVEQRPWDAGARRRYGVALAENKDFRSALAVLRREAGEAPANAVPILVYTGVTACGYPGRTTAEQVASHIARLSDEGYRITGPAAFQDADNAGRDVMVVVVDADPQALDRIDKALAEANGTAVYAATGMERSRAHVQSLRDTGRWFLASAGPVDAGRRPIDARGVRGNPLTHTLYRDGESESIQAMRGRLDASMERAAAVIPEGDTRLLFYPGGDYGQLSLDTDERAVQALRSAVGAHFKLAVAGDDEGYATPGDEEHDPLRLPGRIVPPGWDDEAVVDHLRQRHPATEGRLQLAKALFWNAQHERADYRFAQAEAAGADPREVFFHWGANAYREGDLAAALEKLRVASALDPGNERVDRALKAAEWHRRPLLEVRGLGWEDSDDRSYEQLGATLGGHFDDELRLELFADRNRWDREGLGDEEGNRLGVGGRWYFAEGRWLDGRLWRMDLADIEDHTGGFANVHWPVAHWSGALDAYVRREQIETVEAVRDEILQDTAGLSLHSRIHDMWDLYADPRYIGRSDDNDGWLLEGRLVRRLAEWPFVGLGYRYRFGDSDRDPPEYWAPEELQQHQLYAAWRGDHERLYYNFSAEAGYAREDGTDWRFVWGGRARLEYAITRRLNLTGELNRLETPDYDRTGVMLGVDLRI